MIQYKKGSKREYQTRNKLRKQGYNVLRAAGSHGVFDIVAINSESVRLIQVKNCKKRLYIDKGAERSIENFNCPDNCSKEIWVYVDYDRENPHIFKY